MDHVIGTRDILEVEATTLRAILHMESASEARLLLTTAARALGAGLTSDRADPAALAFDLSLGHGDPVYPLAPDGADRDVLTERLGLLHEDAARAVSLVERLHAANAVVDPATGLFTERAIDRIISRLWTGDLVVSTSLDFGGLIDRDGRATAGVLFQSFAGTVQAEARLEDHVGLHHENTVILAMRSSTLAGGEAFLTRLRRRWTAQRPRPVTFSAGMAEVGAVGGAGAVHAAVDALEAARQAGADRWQAAPTPEPWTPSMGGRWSAAGRYPRG